MSSWCADNILFWNIIKPISAQVSDVCLTIVFIRVESSFVNKKHNGGNIFVFYHIHGIWSQYLLTSQYTCLPQSVFPCWCPGHTSLQGIRCNTICHSLPAISKNDIKKFGLAKGLHRHKNVICLEIFIVNWWFCANMMWYHFWCSDATSVL